MAVYHHTSPGSDLLLELKFILSSHPLMLSYNTEIWDSVGPDKLHTFLDGVDVPFALTSSNPTSA